MPDNCAPTPAFHGRRRHVLFDRRPPHARLARPPKAPRSPCLAMLPAATALSLISNRRNARCCRLPLTAFFHALPSAVFSQRGIGARRRASRPTFAACLQSVPPDATVARPASAGADGEGISARSHCAATYGCVWLVARRSPGRVPTGGDRAAVEVAPFQPAGSGHPCACGMRAWRTAGSGRQIYFSATASKVRSGG